MTSTHTFAAWLRALCPLIAVLVLVLSTPGAAQEAQPARDAVMYPPSAGALIRVEVIAGRLWALQGDRILRSHDLASPGPGVKVTEQVLGMARVGDDLWVLREYGSERPRSYTLHLVNRPSAAPIVFDAGPDAPPVALVSSERALMVVGLNDLKIFEAGRLQRTVLLSTPVSYPGRTPGEIRGFPNPRLSRDGSHLLIGYYGGEWGGRLVSIDTATGQASVRETEPIADLAPDPVHRNCFLAAVSQDHMSLVAGHIMRVCPDQTTELFRPAPASDVGRDYSATGAPISRIFATGDGVFVLSHISAGLEQIGANGVQGLVEFRLFRWGPEGARAMPLPKTEPFGDLWISRAIPGFLVVRPAPEMFNANRDYRPLIVPLG